MKKLERYKSLFYFKESSKPYKGNQKFKQFNKELFNNKIPKNYKVKRQELDTFTILGQVFYFDKLVAINKNNLPHEILDIILIHEMIHAYLVEKDGVEEHHNDPHGKSFMNEVKRIGKISDYEVLYRNDMGTKQLEDKLSELGY